MNIRFGAVSLLPEKTLTQLQRAARKKHEDLSESSRAQGDFMAEMTGDEAFKDTFLTLHHPSHLFYSGPHAGQRAFLTGPDAEKLSELMSDVYGKSPQETLLEQKLIPASGADFELMMNQYDSYVQSRKEEIYAKLVADARSSGTLHEVKDEPATEQAIRKFFNA